MAKTTPRSPLENEIRDAFRTRKRVFIGLITGSSILICLILTLLWYIPYVGLGSLHPAAPWVFGLVIGALILVIAWAALALVLNILLGRPVLLSKRLRGVTIKLFLPLMTLLGRVLGIPKQTVRASFIKVNNELVKGEGHRYPAETLLLLMPHCIQNSRCKFRLTYTVDNCKRCGDCALAGLLALRDAYGVHLAVATGGTIARRIVVQHRPRLIIAVACERDLASGIQDTYPLPVYGILNSRPFGPCLDTDVALAQVEWAIQEFSR
ncbi:MAG: DUF116 domain-containing protein [Desulfovibrionales bacterium]|nr:DUF116 domain-containing protein [Desulfovibrionales bacterium]